MVLHEKVGYFPAWITLVPFVNRQSQDFRERGVKKTVVFRQDTHACERIDRYQVVRIAFNTIERYISRKQLVSLSNNGIPLQ